MKRLELPFAPPIIFFFGLAGSGKSYVASLVARRMGWHEYEAEDDLPPDMNDAKNSGRPFTDEMRSRYFEIIAERLLELKKVHPHIAASQAAYKQRLRAYLSERVDGLELVQIVAPDDLIHQRLVSRGNSVTPAYAASFRANFENPPPGTKSITNDGDDENIMRQMAALYGSAGSMGINR